MKGRLVLLALTLLLLSRVDAHHAASVSGKWQVEAAAADVVSPDGTERWEMVAISGTLLLDQKDGGVTGTWQGRMPAPWPLTGTVDGQTFELKTESRDMPITRNGEQRMLPRRWIFTGTIGDDSLSGAMRLSGGETDSPPQAFTATRVK